MSYRLSYLFDLSQRSRIYLRFTIESFAISAVYILYLLISDVWAQFGVVTHFFNALIWIFAYKTFGLHKDRLRFSSTASYLPILRISLISSLILAIENRVFAGSYDISSLLVYLLLSCNILVGLRVLARQLIRREASKSRENILVYGTTGIAIDLYNAMAFGKKYNVVGFVSDKPESVGSLAGLSVIKLIDVEDFARVNACKLVVFASDSLTPAHQTELLLELDKLGLSVSYAPTIDRAFDYEVQLKAVRPEEVLGRINEIQLDETVRVDLSNKTVLVTGAGGSIGSEICRQVLRYQPKKLVVLELNEFALYTLEQELSSKAGSITQFDYYLGSVTDEAVLSTIFNERNIDIVYHAAAYKHVPIVEYNVIAGIKNNVFGTKCVAEFAHRFGCEKFVLISTDKAVRPTNVMGASKRLAELIVQDLSKSSNTIFAMVRFGNVLGSSGSVIPKFKSQINEGGPLTVTHEEITRYFMSIPEAAHLVLNAGIFATGGEVFLLDMGDPVKIVDLAKTMIRQHGLQPVLASEIADRRKRDNEIVIEFAGLRPGEKLFEELLVDGIAEKTANSKIFKSKDGLFEELNLAKELKSLGKKIKDGDSRAVINHLCQLPLSYQPKTDLESELVDDCADQEPNENTEKSYESHDNDADQERPSLRERVVTSKFGLAILHHYFFFTRGMTLGVRVLVKNLKGEILVVKHSYIPGWHLPGGGVDHGEDIETAARREVYEETGISEIQDFQFLGIEWNNSVSKKDHVVICAATTTQTEKAVANLEISDCRFIDKKKFMQLYKAPDELSLNKYVKIIS